MHNLDRSQRPPVHPLTEITIPRVQTRTLANGLRIHQFHGSDVPYVRIVWIFPSSINAGEDISLAKYADQFLLLGTEHYSRAALAEKIEFHGAQLYFGRSHTTRTLTLICLHRHLDEMLTVVLELLTEANFPEADLDNAKNILLQGLQQQKQRPSKIAGWAFYRALYGPHHANGFVPSEEAIQSITRDKVLGYYQRRWLKQPMEIAVSGKLTDEVLKSIEAIFDDAHWTQGISHQGPVATPYSLHKPQLATELHQHIPREGTQSTLLIGGHVLTVDDSRYHDQRIMSFVLGGYFGSRLMKNLREQNGFTYGVHSQIVAEADKAHIQISTDVGLEVTQAALDAIYLEINRLKTELAPESELSQVRNTLLGNIASTLGTPDKCMNLFLPLLNNGKDYDWLELYMARVKSITAEDIRQIAQTSLNTDEWVQIRVGGTA